MKVKGLRWMVIGLIMLITIINYLDRGTLNYMWVANIDYRLVSQTDALADKGNHAVLAGEQYILTAANGNRDSVSVANVQMKEKNGVTFVTNREGIAIDLGLIDRNDPDASQQAKDILGLITIFFMIAYGISQLVSGKLYDKIGCRKGFFWSVLIWGTADALASLSRGIFSLTFFRMMQVRGLVRQKVMLNGSHRKNVLLHRDCLERQLP
jgi:ACS family hexuronate transporter-like MFS transporter